MGAQHSSSQTTNSYAVEKFVFKENDNGEYKNISIDGVLYFIVLLIRDNFLRAKDYSKIKNGKDSINETLVEIENDSKLKTSLEEIKRKIDKYCTIYLHMHSRNDAKKGLIDQLESEAKLLKETYKFAVFAFAFDFPPLIKDLKNRVSDVINPENRMIQVVAKNLISKLNGAKSLNSLINQWNEKHEDKKIDISSLDYIEQSGKKHMPTIDEMRSLVKEQINKKIPE
ncbi:MAG: hypothetical protein MHPSP_002342 [Paramarteilia canceri]